MMDADDDQNSSPSSDGNPAAGDAPTKPDSTGEQDNDPVPAPEISPDTDSGQRPDTAAAAHDHQQPDEQIIDAEADGVEPDIESGDPYGGHAPEVVKRIMEGALFAAGTALSIAQIAALFETHKRPHRSTLRSLMAELIDDYRGGGVELIEVASGFRFQTTHGIGVWVSRLWEERPQRYSRALLETIALIAYRQPITRSEIEEVRGVSVSTQIVRALLEREWVRVVGHRDVPGRPAMYATTRQFLDHFGLTSLDQLPSLGEIRDLDDINPQLGLEGDDERPAGAVDDQAAISFSSIVDKLREGDRSGKTGNTFIDEELDGELSEMDAVNEAIEQSFDAQRAGHEHPGLGLTDSDPEPEETAPEAASKQESREPEDPETAGGEAGHGAREHDPDTLTEAEHWRIIQEKLAQQQALLDARETDQKGGDDNDH